MKYRVGLFTRPIDQGTSGSGSHLREIASRLVKADSNIQIVFIHYEHRNDILLYKDHEEIIIPRNPLKASKVLKKANLDILHYNPLTIFSPLALKIKKVATIHGAAPLFLKEQYPLKTYLHEKWIVPFYGRKMDYVFSVSTTTKRFLTEVYNIPENKIEVVYNAVDPSFRVNKKSKPNILADQLNTPFIFHLSKFSKRKNPWTILKGFQHLKSKGYPHKLVLGGKGWNNEEVQSFLTKNNLHDSILFTGFILKKQIIELMNKAEIFLFPSFYEGFGMPNLEAMACGCPVITSRCFAIPEIVENNALLLDRPDNWTQLGDLMIHLIENKNEKKELIKKGLLRVKDFSWDKSVQTIIDTYKILLEDVK
jgi:glycosyltransferase involved in cell wall biosynthesis